MFGQILKLPRVLGLLLCGGLLACQSSESDAPISISQLLNRGAEVKLVALGDSVTRGYGVEHPWPELLQEQLRRAYPASSIRVENSGRDGDTAAAGLGRLERDVLPQQPDLVLVAFGLNDLKLRRTPRQLQADLESIGLQLQAAGSEVLLLTTNQIRAGLYTHLLQDYNAVIRELATRHSWPLVDMVEVWNRELARVPAATLLADVAHPTQLGHQLIADTVAARLIDRP